MKTFITLSLFALMIGCGGSGHTVNPYAGNWRGAAGSDMFTLIVEQTGVAEGTWGNSLVTGQVNSNKLSLKTWKGSWTGTPEKTQAGWRAELIPGHIVIDVIPGDL